MLPVVRHECDVIVVVGAIELRESCKIEGGETVKAEYRDAGGGHLPC